MRIPVACRLARAAALLLLAAAPIPRAAADLVVIQRVDSGSEHGEMTLRIRGDNARADISPAVSTLIDAATGDVITLMHHQKTCLRISAATARELSGKIKKLKGENENGGAAKPRLEPTGKKEKLNGHDTEQFVWEFGDLKITCWIARDFPNAAEILRVLKRMQAGAASLAGGFAPDPADFPGLPVKTEIAAAGKPTVTTTVVSVKDEPVDPAVFVVPPDYRELPAPLIPPAAR